MAAHISGATCTEQFNTLAQLATSKDQIKAKGSKKILNGKGSDANNHNVIKGRAKRKLVSNIIARQLADLANEHGNEKLEKSFWNTYYCLDQCFVAEGRIHGNYCKNRFCTVCAAIRKADIMNTYLPILQKWQDPHFVTLTVKAVGAKRLLPLINNINLGLTRIIRQYEKRSQRGTGIKLIGIKSLECNFNPTNRTYNPHFHLIVASREIAETIVDEWLKKSKPGKTNKYAQDIQKITDTEKCLMEVIKYSSKIFTEPQSKQFNKHQKSKVKNRTIYVNALYTIIAAMQGKRVFGKFGFTLPEGSRKKVKQTKEVENPKTFNYNPAQSDWIDFSSNMPLTGYIPELELMELMQSGVDKLLN